MPGIEGAAAADGSEEQRRRGVADYFDQHTPEKLPKQTAPINNALICLNSNKSTRSPIEIALVQPAKTRGDVRATIR
jgi:hypothetical protein